MDDVNVGAFDMLVRFLLAMALFSLATLLDGNWRWFAVLGFVPLISAALRYCPLYKALGWSTCDEAKHHQPRIAH